MAYRDRVCHHLLPRKIPDMPPPQQLARLRTVMHILMDCASEYEAVSEDGAFTPAPEFVSWLDIEVQRGAGSPIRVEAPPLRLAAKVAR